MESCKRLAQSFAFQKLRATRRHHRFWLGSLAALCTLYLTAGSALAQVSELHNQATELAPQSASIPPDQVVSAVAAARRAIQQNPQSASSYLSLGIALRSGGDADGAASAFHQALNLDPHLSSAWLEAGLMADEKGSLEEARADFQKAVEADPKSNPARLELASILFRKGDFEAVKTQLEAILRLDPADANALNGVGLLELQAGKLQEAAESFRRAIASKPRFPEAQMNLANALSELRDWPGAHKAYQLALEEQPDDAMATYGLARALRNLDEPAQAEAKFAKAKTLMKMQTAELRANGENNRGLKLWYAGDLAGAAAAFHSALAQDPTYAEAHNNLGGVLWQQNQKPSALQEFEAAVRSQPGFAKALNNLGNALINSGDLQGGIMDLRAALAAQPAFATGYLNLGVALVRAGQKEQAAEEFRQALLLDSGMAAAHLELGLTMVTNPTQVSLAARDEIEEGLQLNPRLMGAVPEAVLHALAMTDRVIAPDDHQ